MNATEPRLRDTVLQNEPRLVDLWVDGLARSNLQRFGHLGANGLRQQCLRFVDEFTSALEQEPRANIHEPEFDNLRDIVEEISRLDATQGFSPSDTALFVYSFKEPLFAVLKEELAGSSEELISAVKSASRILDRLGLYATEIYQKSREDIIQRQAQELIELSTPVVQLWDKILVIPIIGTLDSERAQTVMESLLDRIVEFRAEIVIIDITGVPTVDTLVAQHLVKTISAARLMGADCILSGIRPQIAQTIVHLGLQIDVTSKATMADAFALALRRTGQKMQRTPVRRES